MSEERRITVLGVVSVEPGESIAFSIPPDLDADAIKAALEAVEAEKVAAAARETKKLREIFLEGADE
jgi:hypothetical protein